MCGEEGSREGCMDGISSEESALPLTLEEPASAEEADFRRVRRRISWPGAWKLWEFAAITRTL